MRRREFVGGLMGAAASPIDTRTIWAQGSARRRRVAIIFGGFTPNHPELKARVSSLRAGLEELGWNEGQNIEFELRVGGGEPERIQTHAAGLVESAPDVIVINSSAALRAVSSATSTIPIVFLNATYPGALVTVGNVARPMANVTGFTSYEPSIVSKWVELLSQMAPAITKTLVISDRSNAGLFAVDQQLWYLPTLLASAQINSLDDLIKTVEAFAQDTSGGLIFAPSTIITANHTTVITLANKHRLPSGYAHGYFAQAGGLFSYGIDVVETFRRGASYVDRILRGAAPNDLPVQQPTKFQLVINLKTARTLGLTVPQALLARADEVIE